jgi:hypothetical protein
MRRTLIALIATASAALTGAFLAAEPASAAGRDTRVTVTVRPAKGPVKSAWLTCLPAGGSHRRAQAACAALEAAGGDPSAIPPADTMCTTEFAPVTAKAKGRWQGRSVRYRKTFSNACQMRLETDALFRL